MYIAYGKPATAHHKSENDFIKLFTFGDMVFMYVETENESFNPEMALTEGLKSFPNGEKWFLMPPVFLASKPLSAEHWCRKETHPSVLRVNFVDNDTVASYIFEHYRMQEENWPHPKEKYDAIFVFGNLLAYYTEGLENREIDRNPPQPLLSTRETPWEKWGDIMENKFLPWENGKKEWREADRLD